MRLTHTLLAGGAAAILFAGSVLAQDDAPTADTVLAVVDGQEITLGQMIVARSQLPDQYQALPDEVLFDGLLEQLIQQTLLANSLDGPGQRIEILIENELRAQMARKAINAAVEAAVTEEAIQAAYDTALEGMEPEVEFRASHILVDTEEEAAAIKAEIDGGADFAEMARVHSTGPSGPNGGDLDWLGIGMTVAPFEEAALALEVGEVSGPVQTQFGWHLILLADTRSTDLPSLEDIRGDLIGQIQASTAETVLADLEAAADVTRSTEGIDPSLLSASDIVAD